MSSSRFSLLVLNWGIFLGGLYLLLQDLPSNPTAWLTVICFSISILLFMLLKNQLPNGESFSIQNALLITYALTYGFSAVWVAGLGIAAYSAVRRQNYQETLFSFGSSIITLWGSLIFFESAGGQFGQLDLNQNYLPLIIFLLVNLVFYTGSRILYKALLSGPTPELVNLIKDEGFCTVLTLITGVLGTVVFQTAGLIGLLLLVAMLYASWRLLKTYFSSEEKYVKTVETFLTITENKIPQYRGHSERVVKFARLMLDRTRVSREERQDIEYAALLHDIGKLGMPEKLLKFHSYLTSDEVRQVEAHSEIGEKLVRQIGGFDKVAALVLSHHEKYNGQGYPKRLAGEQIPFGARVIAVANAFDNLVFRSGLRFDQAQTELQAQAGTELDPDLVNIFLKAINDGRNSSILSAHTTVGPRLEDEARGIVEQLRFYLDKSWVLGSLNMTCAVLYEQGGFRSIGGAKVPEPVLAYLADFLKAGSQLTLPQKEFIIDKPAARIFQAYFVPVSIDSCLVTVFDMTEVLKTEKEREERELMIYRDVISAVTQGKLLLASDDEIQKQIDEVPAHCELRLTDPQDVSRARAMVKGIIEPLPLSSRRKSQLVLCVSEAATNVVKHVGEGKVSVFILGDAVRVLIQDNGPGIDIAQLPQVTLRKGYSTKLSLGYGFTIMLDFLDRLVMSTQEGTTLILEMNYQASKSSLENCDGKEVLSKNACL